MAAPMLWYVNGLKTCLRAGLGLAAVTGTPKVMILSSAYVLDQDNHDFINDVSANEIAAGGGYTVGGLTLGTPTVTTDAASNAAILAATDITGLNVSGCYAVVFVDTGTPATSPLLCIGDASEGGGANVTITSLGWNTSGLAAITAA